MAVKGKGEQVASDSPRAIKTSSSGPGGERRWLPRDAEPSSSSATAVKGKGKQVVTGPHCAVKASGSGPGRNQRSPPVDAESSSSSATAKRRRRAGVLQSDEKEAEKDLEFEEDLDDGGASISETRGTARIREGVAAAGAEGQQEQQERWQQEKHQSCTQKISLSEIMNLKKTDEMLIPFADFLRLVKEITERHSRKVSHWTPKALLFLHEGAEDYLLEVFKDVNQSTTGDMAQPNLWYGDNTKLTPEQEAIARGLSRASTSGIPTYICTMKQPNVMKRQLAFSREFSNRYMFPRLGYDGCETKVFAGSSRTGSKLNFSMIHGELRLLGGWPLFVKDNRIEAGHVCAFMFEEDKEGEEDGALLSLRVHVLGTIQTI